MLAFSRVSESKCRLSGNLVRASPSQHTSEKPGLPYSGHML